MLQGLTLDIEKGNLLRLGRDGYILAACHGTRYQVLYWYRLYRYQ